MMFRNSLMNLIIFVELHIYNSKVNEINISQSFQKIKLSLMSFAKLIYN